LIETAGYESNFGIRFRDLRFHYVSTLEAPSGTAINCASDVANVTAEGCAFADCPQAFAAGSSNGQAPATASYGAGVAITGPCNQVRIVGADCSGVFDFLGSAVLQPYGLSVASGVTNVVVDACDLSGNATYPLYAPPDGTDLRITNSRGYNDLVLELSSTLPLTGTRFNGTTYGYFGPSTFYVSPGASAIKVSNSGSGSAPAVTTGLLTGAFRLDPGEWGEIDHTGSIASFVLVGT